MTSENDQDPTVHVSGHADSDKTAAYQQNGTRTGSSIHLSQPLEAGSVLGRYEIIERIDNGGMGVIYRARHTALGKTVALKVISLMHQSNPQSTGRFLREMQAIGHLDPHPNVLNAYDAGDEGGIQYIATELIEGIQLGDLLKRIGPLSVSEACKIISQAALALEHFRQHDLVHRDIKPSNLMLTRDGTVKVVDMGLALLRDEQAEQITITGEAMGSIDYMAPEQWVDSHEVDWRSDVYSLGCTFYCLLVGHAPFSDQQKGSVARMRAHLDTKFPDVRTKRGDVPRDAAKLLAAMVTKEPESRLTNLLELSERLEVIASGDLEGLVDRGFTNIEKGKIRPRIQIASGKEGSSLDVDAATQLDRSSASRTAVRSSVPARWIVMSVLAIGGLLGTLALIDHNWTPNHATKTALLSARPESEPQTISEPAIREPTEPFTGAVSLVGHQAKVMDMVFLSSPNQLTPNRIASVSEDGQLCIFDLVDPSKPLVQLPAADRAAASVVHDPIAETLAIATENGCVQIRSSQDGRILREEQLIGGGFCGFSAILHTSVFMASDWDGNVWRVDVSTSTAKKDLIASRDEVVYDVDVSPDGTRVVWVGRDPKVTIYNIADQSVTDFAGHKGWVYDVAISPDGTRMATAGHEGEVRVWRFPSGELESKFECVVPQALCFFPNSQHLAVGGRGATVQIWDLDSNRMIDERSVGQSVDCIAVSADSKLLGVGGTNGTLKVWPVSIKQ